MNFQCEELRISDEEFGCTITFSDSKTSEDQFKTVEEIINSEEKYLLIQRTYPEDKNECDYYHLETSETDIGLAPNERVMVAIDQEKLEIDWSGIRLEIGLNFTVEEVENLKEILRFRFKDRVTLKI